MPGILAQLIRSIRTADSVPVPVPQRASGVSFHLASDFLFHLRQDQQLTGNSCVRGQFLSPIERQMKHLCKNMGHLGPIGDSAYPQLELKDHRRSRGQNLATGRTNGSIKNKDTIRWTTRMYANFSPGDRIREDQRYLRSKARMVFIELQAGCW